MTTVTASSADAPRGPVAHGAASMFESPPPPLAPPSPAPEGDGSEEEVTPVVLLLGATMLLVSMLLAHTLKRHDVTFVTESGVAMLIGLLTGWVAWLVLPVAPLKILRAQALHDLIYYAMLPPLIFVAGYTMRKRHFFQNFFTILLLVRQPARAARGGTGAGARGGRGGSERGWPQAAARRRVPRSAWRARRAPSASPASRAAAARACCCRATAAGCGAVRRRRCPAR